MAESGLPGYEAYSWAGLLAPAATPDARVSRLQAGAVRALAQPEVVRRLLDAGAEADAGSAEVFAAFLRSEVRKWAEVVRSAHIQMD